MLALQQRVITQRKANVALSHQAEEHPVQWESPRVGGAILEWPTAPAAPSIHLRWGNRNHRKDHTVTRRSMATRKTQGLSLPSIHLYQSLAYLHLYFSPFIVYRIQSGLVYWERHWKHLFLDWQILIFLKLMMSFKYFNSSFNYSFEGISCMYVLRVFGPQIKHLL